MEINWFTVIAQVINFLILVWLLKRFLYKPILDAVDDREKLIKSQLEDAEAEKSVARREQDEFRKKNEGFEQEKKAMMDKALTEIKEKRHELLEQARSEAMALSAKHAESLNDMQEDMNHMIARKTKDEVFAITRKLLEDIASQSLEEQSAEVFIRRLHKLNEKEKKQFTEAFKSGSKPVIIRSAFDLPEKLEKEIQKAVREILGAKTPVDFKTESELISGIELSVDGYKLAWSISEYLYSFEKDMTLSIKEKSKKETK